MNESERMRSLNLAILTVSDTRTNEDDISGDLLIELVTSSGHAVISKEIVKDDIYQVRSIVSQWIADDGIEVIITTGGTGITGRDSTPEALEPLFDKVLAGYGEMFRVLSYEDIGASTIQSRCIAGVANATMVFSLPGSMGACRLGWEKLLGPQLCSDTKPCNFADLIPRLREK